MSFFFDFTQIYDDNGGCGNLLTRAHTHKEKLQAKRNSTEFHDNVADTVTMYAKKSKN